VEDVLAREFCLLLLGGVLESGESGAMLFAEGPRLSVVVSKSVRAHLILHLAIFAPLAKDVGVENKVAGEIVPLEMISGSQIVAGVNGRAAFASFVVRREPFRPIGPLQGLRGRRGPLPNSFVLSGLQA